MDAGELTARARAGPAMPRSGKQPCGQRGEVARWSQGQRSALHAKIMGEGASRKKPWLLGGRSSSSHGETQQRHAPAMGDSSRALDQRSARAVGGAMDE